jgi:hypothetical protein
LPSFFTGAQALSNVQVTPGMTSAQVSWQGNVIGFGQVQYGQDTSYRHTVSDALNVTDHSLTLTRLQPATAYDFQVCNVHAIDGDCLASSSGSFATLGTFTDQFLAPLVQSTDPASAQINAGKNGRVVPVKVQMARDEGTSGSVGSQDRRRAGEDPDVARPRARRFALDEAATPRRARLLVRLPLG